MWSVLLRGSSTDSSITFVELVNALLKPEDFLLILLVVGSWAEIIK